jgi:gliding motility-associated protein GldM
MALPKNPRQLMINIMYLVLTALLALNVSAEIFNAFNVVNKGLERSNDILEKSNNKIPAQVKKLAKKNPDELQKYADRVDNVSQTSEDFVDYVETLWDSLVEASGGYVTDEQGHKKLKNKKDKGATTRILVDEGKGEVLKQRIMETHDEFLSFVDSAEQDEFKNQIALDVDDKTWREAKNKENWADFNFRQMPIGAVKPMFTKYINDAKSSESAILNYYLEKTGGDDIVFDKFEVVSAADQSYVIAGERYNTEIFLSASSKNVEDLSVKVNGRELPVEDGVAEYSTAATSTGKKSYTAEISFVNPVTKEETKIEREFTYEVGRRSVTVSADKMNVFYIGVDNPITVSAAGVSSNKINVSGSGGGISLKDLDGSNYIVNVTTPGKTTVTVSGGGLEPSPFEFRVKRIPDPVPKLSGKRGGGIANGVFRAQLGLIADLEDFDFEARCNIQGFTLVRVAKRQDPESVINGGGRFNAQAQALVNKATPGDRYFFEEIKARCPGDKAGRNVGSMSFTIR